MTGHYTITLIVLNDCNIYTVCGQTDRFHKPHVCIFNPISVAWLVGSVAPLIHPINKRVWLSGAQPISGCGGRQLTSRHGSLWRRVNVMKVRFKFKDGARLR